MAVVGPGSAQDVQEDIKATLDGASEYEYVTILNPLSDDFAVRVAQDVPVNMPVEIRAGTGLINSENDVIRNYGLGLKGKDFQGKKHIINDTVIKAGQTINLKGNEAQVAVRQLVNEMLQREGQKRLLADPTLRREAEQKIIVARGSVQELMDKNLQSQTSQIDDAINRSNKVQDEQAFPSVSQSEENPAPGTGATYTPKFDNGSQKKLGRPKKADS